ncbi:hypothetical protein M1M34_gp007 [Haloarcula tailed virus 2]|uniref:Uncharacterized protein n=1 Tax=Haloarcula tailed virus 2 TaxID=2877989 RepID=A0AAE8Y1L1_9CAUD|nr:hypothetical protein M1M34_gp007 [Haloarcula tailed virus 2]UBF23158.1 hypothetical protein HATV-2_gp7 [Haloarcula tailed virus 2]
MTLYDLSGFEGFTNGQDIDVEIPEWGEHAGRGAPDVEALSVLGRQGASFEFGNYVAVQSNTDGSVTNQTATFDQYPFADCTIRWSFYSELGRYCDFAWAIPTSSTGFNGDNCYRVRAGTEQFEPFLRKTVNGSSSSLVAFNKLLQRDTYYDFAVEFEETGTEINLNLQVWEYNSSTNSWDDFGSISYTDTDLTHAGNGGIGFAIGHEPSNEARVDNIRFHDQLGQTAAPDFIPTEFQSSVNEGVSVTAQATTNINEDGLANESASISTAATTGVSSTARTFEQVGVGGTSSVDVTASGRAQEQLGVDINTDFFLSASGHAVEQIAVSLISDTLITDKSKAVEQFSIPASASVSVNDVIGVAVDRLITVVGKVDSSISVSGRVNDIRNADGLWNKLRTVSGKRK